MALPDLTGQQIQDTYQRVLQTDGSILYDGTGSVVDTLKITGSFKGNGSGLTNIPPSGINGYQDRIKSGLLEAFISDEEGIGFTVTAESTFEQDVTIDRNLEVIGQVTAGQFEGGLGDGGIQVLNSSALLFTRGFKGQTSASLGLGPAGFVIYSGSATTQLGADTLQGTGFKFVGTDNSSSISFTDQNGGDLEIRTDKFTLQNNGDITASNALFSGTAIARNFIQKSVILSGSDINGSPFDSYLSEGGGGYTLYLDGTLGGEIINNVEFALPFSGLSLADIVVKDETSLINDKVTISIRNRNDSIGSISFEIRLPNDSQFNQVLSPNNIYSFEISFDNEGQKTITPITATDLSIPVTASNGFNLNGDFNLGGNLTSTGDLTVDGIITAKEFHTEFVSSSIIYESGSTKFGDTSDDVHQFTGSTHIQSGSYKVDTYGEGIRWYDGTNYNTNRIQLSSAQNMQLQAGGVIQLQSSTQIINGRDLTFNNSGNTTRFDINNAGGTNEYRLDFSSGSTQLMVISGSGNVGIGTTSPSSKLHISGSLLVEAGTDTPYIKGSQLRISSQTNGAFGTLRLGSINDIVGDVGNYQFKNGSTTLMTIKNTGNVGIGTTSPNAGLEVANAENSTLRLTRSSNTSNYLQLQGGSSGAIYNINTSGTQDHIFQTGGNEKMRLTSAGNLGIGTTSPSAKFHLYDSNTTSGGSYASPYYVQLIRSSTGGSPSATYFTKEDYTLGGTDQFSNSLGKQLYTSISNTGNSIYRNLMSRVHTVSSGTANTIALYSTHFEGLGTGTIANLYSMVIGGKGAVSGFSNVNSTITNTYGLYLANLTSGTQTNDPYAIYQEGTEKIYLQGNVGIGTTSPSQALTVAGNILQTSNANYIATRKIIGRDSNGLDLMDDSGGNGISIKDGGNVGIGTTSPSSKLHVSGANATNLAYFQTSRAQYKFYSDSTSTYTTLFNMDDTGLDIGHNSSVRAINLKTNDTDRLTILGGGNVGIGTTSPSYKFEVAGTNGSFGVGSTGNDIFFTRAGGNYFYGTQTNSSFLFYTNGNLGIFQAASGNVGIGTSSPQAKLDVSGSAQFHSVDIFKLDATANPRLRVGRYNAETLNFDVDDFVARIYHKQDETDSNVHKLNLTVDSDSTGGSEINLGFRDNDGSNESTKLIISSSGNVGIGTTSPQAKLHVQGDAVYLGTGGSGTDRALFIARSTNNTFEFNNNNGDRGIRIVTNNGSVGGSTGSKIYGAAGGITLEGALGQENLSLTTDGKVGINNTSPDASAILDIASTSKGVVFPRMTSAQRTAISSPTTGLIVYQTDSTEGLYIYKSTGWVQII